MPDRQRLRYAAEPSRSLDSNEIENEQVMIKLYYTYPLSYLSIPREVHGTVTWFPCLLSRAKFLDYKNLVVGFTTYTTVYGVSLWEEKIVETRKCVSEGINLAIQLSSTNRMMNSGDELVDSVAVSDEEVSDGELETPLKEAKTVKMVFDYCATSSDEDLDVPLVAKTKTTKVRSSDAQ